MPTTGYAAAYGTDDLLMGYEPEVQWGVTPPNPTFQLIRLDSEGFSGSKSRTRPSEIDPSGQSSAAITTKEEATGSLNFSVSAGTHNELLAASIGGTFSTPIAFTSGAATCSFAAPTFASGAGTAAISASSGNTCTLTVSDGAFLTTNAGVIAGKKIKIASGTISGTARISGTPTATVLTLFECSFTPVDGTIAGVTTISSGNTTVLTASDGAFTTTNPFVRGQFVKIYTGTGTTHRGIARIAAAPTATTLTLDMCSFVPLSVEAGAAAGATSIKGSYVRNGITFQSYTVEKKFSSTAYMRYAGSFPTGGSLDVGTGEYLKGTLSFLCKYEVAATTMIAGATYPTAFTGTVIDSVKGIGTVFRGVDSGNTAGTPSAINGVVQKLGIKWSKEGAASQGGIGATYALGMRSGKILVTGSMSTYFADFELFNQYKNEQAGPICFHALDGDAALSTTKGFVLSICNGTIMNPKVVAGGPGQDVMAEFEVEGNPDVTGAFGGKTVQIDYFG